MNTGWTKSKSKSWSMAGRILLAAGLLCGGIVAAEHRPAAACSCAEPVETVEALAQSEAVFAGRVLKIKGDSVYFDVAMLWKGPQQRTIVLENRYGSTCRYPFVAGQEYVVYATKGEGALQTSICTRTIPVEQASDELRALKQPIYNPAGEAMNQSNERDLSAWFMGLGALLLGLVGYLLFTSIRKKRG